MASNVDIALDCFRALFGCPHDNDTSAGTRLGEAGPHMWGDHLAVLLGKLTHPLVGDRIGEMRPNNFALSVGNIAHQAFRDVPRLILVLPADNLQPHAEADVVGAAVLSGKCAHFCNVSFHALNRIPPEEMHVGMPGGEFRGLLRTATEIKAWIWFLISLSADLGLFQLVKFAIIIDTFGRLPQGLADLDLFLHRRIALLLSEAGTLSLILYFVLTGDEID